MELWRHSLRPLGHSQDHCRDIRLISPQPFCDSRGTAEYNLALRDRRATAARSYLVSLGISGGRVTTDIASRAKVVRRPRSRHGSIPPAYWSHCRTAGNPMLCSPCREARVRYLGANTTGCAGGVGRAVMMRASEPSTALAAAPTRSHKHFSPAQVLVLSFIALIATGTILLRLPASATRESLTVLDALFTATSA